MAKKKDENYDDVSSTYGQVQRLATGWRFRSWNPIEARGFPPNTPVLTAMGVSQPLQWVTGLVPEGKVVGL